MPGPSSPGSSTAPESRAPRMRASRPRRLVMQLALPIFGLDVPAPLAWEQLAPEHQAEAVSVLARLMAQFVQPAPEEGEPHEQPRP